MSSEKVEKGLEGEKRRSLEEGEGNSDGTTKRSDKTEKMSENFMRGLSIQRGLAEIQMSTPELKSHLYPKGFCDLVEILSRVDPWATSNGS